jgi:DnaJ-domain-containing protein 1
MSVYLLPLALGLLVLGAVWVVVQWVIRRVRRAFFVQSASFDAQPRTLGAHDKLTLTANVSAAGGHRLKVQGVVACALLEHRERCIHEHAYDMTGDKELRVEITMPSEMLKSGVVGDAMSSWFSEEAHWALIQWFVEFRVRAEDDTVVLTRRIPLDVPVGRALTASRKALEEIIVEKCTTMHNDMVLNWLVHLANADGSMRDAERDLLRNVLQSAHGAHSEAEADQRIAEELQKKVGVDPLVVRQHMPPHMLNEFYRLLYAMAWRDGVVAKSERTFLNDAIRKIGLDKYRVDELEREILADVAAHSIK